MSPSSVRHVTSCLLAAAFPYVLGSADRLRFTAPALGASVVAVIVLAASARRGELRSSWVPGAVVIVVAYAVAGWGLRRYACSVGTNLADAGPTPWNLVALVPLVVAALAPRAGALGVAFTGGVVMAVTLGAGSGLYLWAGPALVALGVGAADGEATWRRGVSMAAAGLAFGSAIHGVRVDLCFSLAHPAVGDWPASAVWAPDPWQERTLRLAVEVAVCLACIPLARGRTVGLIALALSTFALAWVAATCRGPFASAGCTGWGHPVSAHQQLVVLAVAVAPWIGPAYRALCPSRDAISRGRDE